VALKAIPSKVKPARQTRSAPLPSEGGVGRSFYQTKEWADFRSAIVKERGRRCEKCGAIGPVVADHIQEVRDGGALYERRNIMLMCLPCHNSKTAESRVERNITR
jgi:5-methylcytosine-specific restriction endonuclease McrA